MRAILAAALVLASTSAWAQTAPNCPAGQAYDPNRRSCVVLPADTTSYVVIGGIIIFGAVGAILLANNGDKTVSP